MSERSSKRAKTSNEVTMSKKVLSTQLPIIVGKKPNRKTFECHRILLSAFSEVFQAMFFGPWAEMGKEVELPEDDPHAFEIMTESMLTGKIRLERAQDAIDVYKLVDKYQVIQVGRKCLDYMLRHMTAEDVIEIYEMANEFSEQELRLRSFFYICKNATEVVKSKNFIYSKFSTVQSIVSRDKINVSSEADLHNAVFLWLKEERRRNEEGDELKPDETVKSLLSQIRFLTMTVAEFQEGPAKNKFLTDHVRLSIFTNIVSPDAVELPEICNRSKTERRFPSPEESKLSSKCKKHLLKFSGTSVNINQKSKIFSSDTLIFGASFRLQICNANNIRLTIKNITKNTKKEIASFDSMWPKVKFMTDDPIFVGDGEECEISLSAEIHGKLEMYCCDQGCQLEEFYASGSGAHFDEIFIFRM